jgi:hypothetical protein
VGEKWHRLAGKKWRVKNGSLASASGIFYPLIFCLVSVVAEEALAVSDLDGDGMRDGAAVIMVEEFERQKNEGQKYFPEPLTLKFFCPESFCRDCWEGSPCRSSFEME